MPRVPTLLLTDATQSVSQCSYPQQGAYPCGPSGYSRKHLLLILRRLQSLGLGDTNVARVKTTERYLINCNEIFAVCKIGRAATDDGVAAVFSLAKEANLSHVGIICTNSDVREVHLEKELQCLYDVQNIKADEAAKEWKDAAGQEIITLMRKISSEKQRASNAEDNINEFRDTDPQAAQQNRETYEEAR